MITIIYLNRTIFIFWIIIMWNIISCKRISRDRDAKFSVLLYCDELNYQFDQ